VTVVSLCDLTGNMVRPWADAGHDCLCLDTQHSIRADRTEGRITYRWADVRSMTPADLPDAAIVFAFPAPQTDAQDACAWAMALSGMGPKEYWGKWTLMADRIRVYGTKRASRLRDIPLVQPIAVPTISREAFKQRLEHRTKKRVSPYDFRRTFARWMESAGVTRARRVSYMGHAAGDVTSLYERSEIDAHLVADAAKLRTWLGMEPTEPKGLRQVK
jgi:integrase